VVVKLETVIGPGWVGEEVLAAHAVPNTPARITQIAATACNARCLIRMINLPDCVAD
jgi:hypothetical protein